MIAELAEPRTSANVPRPFPRGRGGVWNETSMHGNLPVQASLQHQL